MKSKVRSLTKNGPDMLLPHSQGGFLGGPLRVGVSILADLHVGSTPRRKAMESYSVSVLAALKMSPDLGCLGWLVCLFMPDPKYFIYNSSTLHLRLFIHPKYPGHCLRTKYSNYSLLHLFMS